MLEFGYATDVGRSRSGQVNQDKVRVLKKGSNPVLLLLADGMGGYGGGVVASQVVMDSFEKIYAKASALESPIELLKQGILAAHDKMLYTAFIDPNLQELGSTMVGVVVDQKNAKLFIGNVGDSRAYLFHRSGMKQLSFDHSEVAELKRNNILDTQQAQNYKRKNLLTQSISSHYQKNSLQPFFDIVPFVPDSVVVLCSDGVWGVVPEVLIHLIAMEYAPQEAADRLVIMANDFGGPDNISVLITRRKQDTRRYQRTYSVSMEDTR